MNARQRHEKILLTQDYNQVECAKYSVNLQPCVASTYPVIPVDDIEGRAIINGTLAVTPEDVIVISFLPQQPQNNSICVISWLKGSKRAQRLLSAYKINLLTDSEKQDLFLSFAFRSPTIYMSPTWWKSSSDEEREFYRELQIDASKEFPDLV